MKTKKELEISSSIRQLHIMQEEFMSNKNLDLDSRINVVKYLEEVKNNITTVLNNNTETEKVASN